MLGILHNSGSILPTLCAAHHCAIPFPVDNYTRVPGPFSIEFVPARGGTRSLPMPVDDDVYAPPGSGFEQSGPGASGPGFSLSQCFSGGEEASFTILYANGLEECPYQPSG